MERTTSRPQEEGVVYTQTDEPIVLSKPLLDLLLREENPAELIALYTFYYYTAKWQQTNQPKATTAYVAQGLHWGEEKVRAVKKRLRELGLIEDYVTRNEYHIDGHYIKVNFIWAPEPAQTYPKENARGRKTLPLAKTASNALNPKIKENALNPKIKEKNPVRTHACMGESTDLPILPEFKNTFTQWLRYKHDRRESYRSKESTMLAYRKLLRLSHSDPTVAQQIVEESMANNWAGLFELKAPINGHRNAHSERIEQRPANNFMRPDWSA